MNYCLFTVLFHSTPINTILCNVHQEIATVCLNKVISARFVPIWKLDLRDLHGK